MSLAQTVKNGIIDQHNPSESTLNNENKKINDIKEEYDEL